MHDYATALFSLQNTVALVTGATRGIGLASVRALASAGACVILTGLESDDPVGIAAGLADEGLAVEGCVLDVTDAAASVALIDRIRAQHGRLDTLVCNAGVAIDPSPTPGQPQRFDGQAQERLESMFSIHVQSVLTLCDSALPLMATDGGGSVIIMSSLSGLRGNKVIGLYGVTKAANAQIARNLAVQWGPRNIRANALAPGVIDTPFASPITQNEEIAQRRREQTPLKRFGNVDNVAGTVLYLASNAGSFTTGQTLVVDGGTIIND
jgi:NAD(P)-dependent dehydrogenase (short-subunit alcohol dehydrogenase family)